MKAAEFFSDIYSKVIADKRILSGVVAVTVAIVALGGYLGYQKLAERWAIPTVSGANFSLEYRKIPFDAKSIDITFSTDLDPASVTSKNVTMSPFVEGKANIKNGNTVSYALDKTMTIGETYTFTIGADVRSVYGKTLGQEQAFVIEAIAGAQATKILPSGKLQNLGQNLVVLFNIPVVPLTNLDQRDKLPCPLEIAPKIAGKCQWTNGNVLEFIPDKPLEAATKYHLKVADTPGLLYPLRGVLENDIITPELMVSTETGAFDPRKMIIKTSAPVDADELARNLTLTALTPTLSQGERGQWGKGVNTNLSSPSGRGVGGEGSGGTKLEVQLQGMKNEDGTMSETMFLVTPKSGSLLYSHNYRISVAKGLKPKYGTEPLATDFSVTARSADFLSASQVFRKIYDASGALSDTPEYTKEDAFIPSQNVFFRQTFMEEVALDKNLFTLRTASGQTVDFSLAYVKEDTYDDRGNKTGTAENKHMIDVTPAANLGNGTRYEFVVNRKANNSLPDDIIKTYATAPAFQILGQKFLNNTETCLYMNNELGEQEGVYSKQYSLIKTVPASKVHDLTLDGQMNYQTNVKTYHCEQKPGQIAYILGTRFEPQKNYSIVIPANLEDKYGNKLGKDVSFSVKTGNIDPKDIYLYSSLNKPVQIIPSNLPIVLNILSVNTDRANVEVCEMDANGYKDYLNNGYKGHYNPICTRQVGKTLTLVNRFWNLTPNKIDLEKDVLATGSTSPFLLVRGSTSTFNKGENGFPEDGREFLHMFVRSNLALTLEDAKNTKILFAPSFDGKNLPDNLTFDTYARNNAGVLEPRVFPIKWNAAKKYYELTDPDNKLSFLIARNDRYFGVLDKNSDQTSNYDFKYISGQDSSTKDYLYLYSDRPLYKAGDTVFFKWLLRQFNFDGYRGSPTKAGKLKVVDENGTVLTEMDVKPDANSNFNGKFILPKQMPLGHYRFDFYAGTEAVPVYNNGEFDVSAYKNPTFKVNISADKSDASIGDKAQLSANAEYYFGGRLVNADYSYSVLTQVYFFDAKDYREYQFGRGSEYFDCVYWGSCSYGDSLVTTATGRLDGKGETKISYDYPKTDNADHMVGEKIYTYTLEIADPDTQKTNANSASQILHTTDAYVGIKAPYWNVKKDGIKASGVVLDYDAKGISGRDVKLELWRREWKEVKKQGVDGTFYNESSVEEKKESEKTVNSDSKGEFTETFTTQGDGEYEIRVMYTGANKQTFVSSSIVYVSGETATFWNDGNNTVTDLVADKTMMKIGETAAFTLKSPVASGKMLVTVEKDDGVLDSFVRDITSTTERIEVPIKDSYVPNFYVKVFLIGQDAGAKLPVYKRALAVMKVTTDPKKLSVTVTPEKKQYLPGDKVKLTVAVKDSSGRPVAWANGSLSVVDESLLALAGNPLKNPFAFFYDMKRYLGIETYISLVNLIEKLEVKDVSLGEKGGAGEGTKGGSSRKKRGIFKDTAFWQADFTTGKDGNVVITTDALPDNLTTWVIEALVSTTAGNRVGLATEKVMTTKTVVINENLPRFLGSSDAVTFSPVVFNKTGKDQSFEVSINADNMTVKSPIRTVFVKNGASYIVPFEAVIAEAPLSDSGPFSSKVVFKAVAKDSGELDEVENTLPIVATSTRETVATIGKTANSVDERINLSADIRKNGGSVNVHYAASLLPNILSGIDFLKNFPYGCSEQITSAIMPTVYLKQLYDSVNVPFDLKTLTVKEYVDPYQGYQERSLDTVLRGYLVEIRNFQRLNGGFGYWTTDPFDDYPLTIRLVSALSEIRSIGYTPNDTMMENAMKYLKTKFYENKRPYCTEKDCGWSVATRLATIEAILDNSSQDYEAYKMYKLLPAMTNGESDNLAQVNRARVLVKLLRINALTKGEKDSLQKTAEELIKSTVSDRLAYSPRGAFLGDSGAGSRLEATARFVELLSLMGPTALKEYGQIVNQMQRWIISQKRTDGSFGSTAETATVVRSLAHLMQATGELRDVNIQTRISLDTALVEEKNIDQKNKLEVFAKTIGLDSLKDNSTIHLEKSGQGNLYYDIALDYHIPAKDVAARDEGFFVEQAYYDYDAYKSIQKAKDEEWAKYLSGSTAFKDLKYPKETVTYLKPLESLTVGKLVYVYNRIITGEARDQVAFEGFIPSGSELVNPELKTETVGKDVSQKRLNENIFDHEEWQNDRYFGTVRSLDAGVYTFGFIIRPTHAGTFGLLPSRAFEFYHPEVFGRVNGKTVTIK